MTALSTLFRASSAAIAVALASTSIAYADTVDAAAYTSAAEADTGGLAEITVTAQKRETSLQKTPIAISVASGDDLRNRQVQSLADLADGAIPSLRIAPFYSRTSALTVGIRGIVPFDANQPSRDSGVGIYIDGVYLGRSQGLGAALYDIERVEVLKGPQGTLFGRNATGGALSIVTKKPTGEFAMRTKAGLRNFGGHSVESHVDLPEFANISVKLDGIVTKRDGTVKNPMGGEEDFNSYDRRGLHARVLWQPTSDFSADYSFDISRDANTPYYQNLISLTPGFTTGSSLVQVQPNRVRNADIGAPMQLSVGKTHGHMLMLTWSASDAAELRSITSYRKLTQGQWDNGAAGHGSVAVGGAKFARYSLADVKQSQYSQELQLVGSVPQFSYVLGAFYYHEKGWDNAWAPNTLQWNADPNTGYTRLPTLEAGAATPLPDRESSAKARSLAVFGQVTWTPALLNEAFHLTVGARYTRDKKTGELLKVNGGAPVAPGRTPGPIPFGLKENRFDPAFTAAFDISPTIHAYAKWGQAYRAGGANSRSLTYRSFGSEEVQTSEIGLKTELFDRSVRVNLAAYDTRYKDMQVDFVATLVNSNRTTTETVNVPGTAKIRGFEADAEIAVAEGLKFSASYAYTDSKLPKVDNPFVDGVTPEAIYTVFTPKHAGSVSADFERSVGLGTLRAHIDANIAGGYHSLSNDPVLSDKSFIVNGRLALGEIELDRGARLELSLWSRNLLNEDHTFLVNSTGYRSGRAVAGQVGIFNEPRTFGFDATVAF